MTLAPSNASAGLAPPNGALGYHSVPHGPATPGFGNQDLKVFLTLRSAVIPHLQQDEEALAAVEQPA